MAKLAWDQTGDRLFETGVDRGVLFVKGPTGYGTGVAWNGLTAVTESPSGAEPSPQYADNIKYLNLVSAEEFGGTIEAFTYPDEFSECNGEAEPAAGLILGQQDRKEFGFVYRTKIGNDVNGQNHGYKLHFVWGALAAPSEKAYTTVNDSPEAATFSWEFTTTAVAVPEHKPVASASVDSTKATPAQLKAIEDLIYGTETLESEMPTPSELITLLTPVGP